MSPRGAETPARCTAPFADQAYPRVKDLDGPGGRLIVRQGKGDKDRVTVLPQCLKPALCEHLEKVKALDEHDLANGLGEAPLPRALAAKYPTAGYLSRSSH